MSPHEFAVLLLVNDSAESDDFDHIGVEVPTERQLVTLKRWGPDHYYVRVTLQGYVLLKVPRHARTSGRRMVTVSYQAILLMVMQPDTAWVQSPGAK